MKPGRFVSIPVYTLSFKEYLDFKSRDSRSERELLEEYIRFGGFPIIALGNYDEQSAYQIVNGEKAAYDGDLEVAKQYL